MKVSDFKMAEVFLRAMSRKRKCDFVDVDVEVAEQGDPGWLLDNNKIVIRGANSLGQTLMGIIGAYIESWNQITGSQVVLLDSEKTRLLQLAAAVVRRYLYADGGSRPDTKSTLIMSLRQFPFVWLFLRDIVSPVWKCEIKDSPIVAAPFADYDAAAYVESMVSSQGTAEPTLIVNLEVEPLPYRYASLLVASLELVGLDPKSVVNDLINCPDLINIVYGYSRMALVSEEEVDEFLISLSIYAGCWGQDSLLGNRGSEVWKKEAQQFPQPGDTGRGRIMFPHFGPMGIALVEEMLDVVRKPDWTVREILQPHVEALWDEVAEEKKRRGKEDFALEDLLRVQSKGMRPQPGATLQGLLSEQRIW